VGGSVIRPAAMLVLTQDVETGFSATGSLKDSSSQRSCVPGLCAGQKGNGKGPTADGAIAVRATPEPAAASCPRLGGEVPHALAGAADPSYSTASRPSREAERGCPRGRGRDIPGRPKPDGQQEAATTQGEEACAKDALAAGVGPPDALKGACPVRVRAGMKPAVERQQGASFDSHSPVGILPLSTSTLQCPACLARC
jgi:hypothetical protein